MMAFLLMPSVMLVSAQDVTITPTFFDVTGDVGSWIMKSVIVHNNGGTDAGITVTSEMDGCMIPAPATVVPAHGDRTISIIFMITKAEIGWITYTTGTEQFSQLISIKPNKVNVTVMMFPTAPKGGDTVSFLIMNDVVKDAQGFLVCMLTGNNYLINIVNGVGTVKLNESDYGAAYYSLSAENMLSISKDFTILKGSGAIDDTNGSTSKIVIDGPAAASVGSKIDYSIYQDEKLLTNQPVKITDPQGTSSTDTTGYFGSVNVEFDMVGTWKLFTIKDTVATTKNVIVTKTQKSLSLVTKNPAIGEEVRINVFSGASVTITDSEGSQQDVTVSGEYATFIPEVGGQYQVTAENSDSYASPLTFTVKTEVSYGFFDSGGRQTYALQKGKGYYIKMIDVEGNAIDLTGETITVTNIEDNVKETIDLFDTGGYWKPDETGEYSFSYKGDVNYLRADAQKTVSLGVVIPQQQPSSFPIEYVVLGIILVVVIILLVRFRQFVPILNGQLPRKKKEGDVGNVVPPQ
jgi:hypothetical protein